VLPQATSAHNWYSNIAARFAMLFATGGNLSRVGAASSVLTRASRAISLLEWCHVMGLSCDGQYLSILLI
jgi:hypothetical protein